MVSFVPAALNVMYTIVTEIKCKLSVVNTLNGEFG